MLDVFVYGYTYKLLVTEKEVDVVMARKYHVAKTIIVNPSQTAKFELFRVPTARSLIIKEIYIHFPTGSNYTLLVSLYRGEEKVFPIVGEITGDNVLFKFDVELRYDSNSIVYARISNTDDTNAHRVQIIIIGELIEK